MPPPKSIVNTNSRSSGFLPYSQVLDSGYAVRQLMIIAPAVPIRVIITDTLKEFQNCAWRMTYL